MRSMSCLERSTADSAGAKAWARGGGEGFDLEDNKGGAVPGDEVEVSEEAAGAPAAGDDGVAEPAEVEEGGVFAALAGEEVGWERGFAVGAGADGGVEVALEGERQEVETQHGRLLRQG